MKKTVELELQDGVTAEDLAHNCNRHDDRGCFWDMSMFKCPFGKKQCFAIKPEDWKMEMKDEQN